MNKFISNLTASNSAIKEGRAKIVSEDAFDASEELVRGIKLRIRELERRLMNLSDMNRDSEFSLKVVKDDFNAKAWIEEIQEVKINLANARIELELAMETHSEWFTEKEEVKRKVNVKTNAKEA